jgi:5-methyltetrahydrofolate--homocysteine methyltransferase
LIGGATTSKVHTAVKIEPHYKHPVIYVNDASRSVPVVSNLLSKEHKAKFIEEVKAENARTRDYHKADRAKASYLSLAKARENKFVLNGAVVPAPAFTGTKVFADFPLEDLIPYIDWTPFFISWEMKGSYPKILSDPHRGTEAKKLFDDAKKMLDRIVKEKWLTAKE